MINIREITSVNDFTEFINENDDKLCIIKLGAPWCGPCHLLDSTLEKLDIDKIDGALFARVNVDEDETEDIAVNLNIRNIPVMVYFRNGEELKRTVGAVTADEIYNNINSL